MSSGGPIHSSENCLLLPALILLLICLPIAFHGGSAKFTTGNFECMVRLKKFSLQKGKWDTWSFLLNEYEFASVYSRNIDCHKEVRWKRGRKRSDGRKMVWDCGHNRYGKFVNRGKDMLPTVLMFPHYLIMDENDKMNCIWSIAKISSIAQWAVIVHLNKR